MRLFLQFTSLSRPTGSSGIRSFTVSIVGGPFNVPPLFDLTDIQYTASLSAIITDTSDIMNGIVTVNLTGPIGTTGELDLDEDGSDAKAQDLSQRIFSNLTLGSHNLKLNFDTVLPGIYTVANGIWKPVLPPSTTPQRVTVPDHTLSPWIYFRKILYTQYNVPHESACSGGDGRAWIVSKSVVQGNTVCHFRKITLNAEFIGATRINGTGIEDNGEILKNAAAVNLGNLGKGQLCVGQYPPGAIGYTPRLKNGNDGTGNTFETVSTIQGSCPGRVLVPDESLAMPAIRVDRHYVPVVVSNVEALKCGDNLNLDSGNYTTASTRSVDDYCPACNDPRTYRKFGADGHIDAFSPSPACTGGDVGNLGLFYTSFPTY